MDPIPPQPSQPLRPLTAPPQIMLRVVDDKTIEVYGTQYSIKEETIGEAFWEDIKALTKVALGISVISFSVAAIVVLGLMTLMATSLAALIAVLLVAAAVIKHPLLCLAALPFICIACKQIWAVLEQVQIEFEQILGSSLCCLWSTLSSIQEWLNPSEKRVHNNHIKQIKNHAFLHAKSRERVKSEKDKMAEYLQNFQAFCKETGEAKGSGSPIGGSI